MGSEREREREINILAAFRSPLAMGSTPDPVEEVENRRSGERREREREREREKEREIRVLGPG